MSIKQEPGTLREDMADFNSEREIKIDNGENIPWVKTEDSSIEEISEFPISSNSQEDWVKQEVSTLDISSGQEYCCNINNTDLLQEKDTNATPYNLNSSYTYITDTSLQYSKEFSQHKTHMTVKSELNMSNDSSSDTKVHVTGNIQEFCKYLPSTSSDDVFPKQEEQVKVYKCCTSAYSSNSLFQLYQHYSLHEMDTVYICDLCQSSYQYFNDLKCHLASHINDGENSVELFYGRKENLIEYDKTCENVEHVSQDVYPQNNDQNVKLKLLCTDHYKCSYKMEGELKCQNVLHKGDENSFLNMSKNQSEKLRDSSSGEYSHKYSCDLCNYSCRNLSRLKQHLYTHSGEKPYSCDMCSYSSSNARDLKRHKRHHTGEKPYSCDMCNYSSAIAHNLKMHKRCHTGEKPYSCDMCSYSSSSACGLKRHKRFHTGEKPYSCDMCNYSSAIAHNLKIHKRCHTGEKPYSCDMCNYSSASARSLKMHKRCHTGEKPYSCDMCSYSCSSACGLKRHKRRHTGEKPYSCDMCSYKCANTSDLKRHKRHHTGEKPYSRDMCSFSSASASGITKHKICHTNELPYSCDMCYYSSRSASDLKRHIRCHTGEKPYLSYVEHVSQDVYHQNNGQNIKLKLLCTDYYKMEDELKCQNVSHKGDKNLFLNMSKHPSEKLRDSSSGEYSHRYSCDLCNYSCRYLSRLKQHLYTHSGEKPYSCDLCSYTCICPSMLKIHKRCHTGEKPYSCDMCNYSSAIAQHLKIHKRCHTGEKPYTCDMCSYKCANTSDLKKHKKCHTGEKPLYSCDLCSYTCVRASGITKHKICHTNELPY